MLIIIIIVTIITGNTDKYFAPRHVNGSFNFLGDAQKLNVVLASNADGWDKMTNGELEKELAHNERIKLSGFVPKHTEKHKELATELNIKLFDAKFISGYSETELLAHPPDDLKIDVLMMHCYGFNVGRQAQVIKDTKNCIWAIVVHTICEELEKYLKKTQSSEQSEQQPSAEHELQVTLCQKADLVIAVGPKVAEAYKAALSQCGKEGNLVTLTPGISEKYLSINRQCKNVASENFRVLVSGSTKYFQVKGCDIAARAISLLQDASYHLILVAQPKDDDDELYEAMQKEEISLNQLTIRHCSAGDTETWFEYLHEVDLLIKPSRTEGFGMSGLRAISANVPVLISGNTGLGMTLKTVKYGPDFVVDSEDPQAWAEKIREFRDMEPKALRSKVGKLKKEYMMKYEWKEQCEKLVDRFFDTVHGL